MVHRIFRRISGIFGWMLGLGLATAGAEHIHSTLQYDGPWQWDELTMTTTIQGEGMHQTTRYKGTACITGYTGSATNLVIPQQIAWSGSVTASDGSVDLNYSYEVDVVAIGYSAFYGKSSLTSVTIPDSVTIIGTWAFHGCSGLTSVTIGNGVTSIGDRAFAGCSCLTSVKVLGNVTNDWYSDNQPFANCTNIETIVLGERMTKIGNYMFYDCPKVQSLTIPDGVTSIGVGAFSGCSALPNLTIPDVVKWIGNSAFSGCSGLTIVTVLGNVTNDWTSDGRPFYGCTNIETIVLGEKMTKVGDNMFCNCPKLQSLTIPDGVTSIGEGAFYDCSGLTSVTLLGNITNDWRRNGPSVAPLPFGNCTNIETIVLGEKMTKIGKYMFYNCPKVQSLTIPDNVTNIGDYAFYNCSGLTIVTVLGNVTNDWTSGGRPFYGCTNIETIVLGERMTKIGNWMFCQCPKVQSIAIPLSVTNIGASAFQGWFGLTGLVVSDGVESIGSGAFSGCTALARVVFGESVESIGASAFNNCYSLTRLALPGSLRTIGESAFAKCTALGAVELGGAEEIGVKAFEGCTGLRAVSLPEGARSLGAGAFSGCTALATVTLPSGVEEVGAGAFSGASVKSLFFDNAEGAFLDAFSKESLRTLYLGESARGVTGERLGDCLALSSLMVAKGNGAYAVDAAGALFDKGFTRLIRYPAAASAARYAVPETVRNVDASAFSDATALREVAFGGAVEGIGESAFDWCIALERVVFPAGVESVGAGAFRVCPSLDTLRFEGTGHAVPVFGASQFAYGKPVVQIEESEASRWAATLAQLGLAWEAIGAEPEAATTSTPVAVTHSWLESRAAQVLAANGGDYEAAAKATAANGRVVWECYVAGLDLEDEESVFTAGISFDEGVLAVSVSPWPEDGVERTYTVYGKKTFSDAEGWTDVTNLSEAEKRTFRFFRVGVGLK